MKYLIITNDKTGGTYLETIEATNIIEATKYAKPKNAFAQAATKCLVSFDLKRQDILKIKNKSEYIAALKKLI